MDQNLFRKISTDRLSSPEQLDRLITVTSSRLWLPLIAVICILVAAITWGITGNISTNVKAEGMLITRGGTVDIYASTKGQISDIRVVAGDYVEEGEIVARINQNDLVDEITALTEKSAVLKQSGAEDKEILNYMQQIKSLKNKLNQSTVVISHEAGRVTEVNINTGDEVEPGTAVISIVDANKDVSDLIAALYVPVESGKKLKAGMETKISLSIVQEEEYGYLFGRVVSVSEYPVSVKTAARKLGSNELAESYVGNKVCLEVLVELEVNKKTESGYQWSTQGGPPLILENGTVCSASVIVDSQKPIEKVFPQIKNLFGR
ncbi:MAG: bacteriocin system secretion protein [Lachnospiraceae bacterium]|nr:bacteriocin system secretion protein [Lachnospiraceae bacterium]